MGKQYGVVFVRFINKGNTLSSKEYAYNVDEELYKKLSSISFTYQDIIFGFDYYTKLVSFGLEDLVNTADESNPFGNFIPFLMMGDNSNSDDILPLMLMMNSKGGAPSMDFSNPLMFYVLMGDGKLNKFDKMLPLMLMMNQNK